jgi:hypothetical protein
MLPFLPIVPVAQINTVSTPTQQFPPSNFLPPPEQLPPQDVLPPQEVAQPTEMRALPGRLDNIPVFNSNSPEVVGTEGILLSTFPPQGKVTPEAHLNMTFKGRFDVFSHHITRARTAAETRSMFQGIIIHNPGLETVKIEILQAASYLTRPDALFVELPDYVDNSANTVFSGPGSRAMSDILRGLRQSTWLPVMEIPPGQSRMLMNLPIPAGTVTPTSNGRSTLLRLWSSGPVHVANLAMLAPLLPNKTERPPTLEEWQRILVSGRLAGPRDLLPTPIVDKPTIDVVYGRVAGVAEGSLWETRITDTRSDSLNIPKPGRSFSYGISTLYDGTLGTGQIQSARMLARYPDTAYHAHGNYGIKYSLTLPLRNKSKKQRTVTISLQTPVKEDEAKKELLFFTTPENRIFFRGTVRLSYNDDKGVPQTRYMHLIQRRGQLGEALLTLNMKPNERRLVEVDLLYPPDATPPQVLTVRTLDEKD